MDSGNRESSVVVQGNSGLKDVSTRAAAPVLSGARKHQVEVPSSIPQADEKEYPVASPKGWVKYRIMKELWVRNQPSLSTRFVGKASPLSDS